jgi:hypothetical protein
MTDAARDEALGRLENGKMGYHRMSIISIHNGKAEFHIGEWIRTYIPCLIPEYRKRKLDQRTLQHYRYSSAAGGPGSTF